MKHDESNAAAQSVGPNYIRASLQDAVANLQWLCTNTEALDTIDTMARLLALCLQSGSKVITCGNGGSFCDASHLAEELSGRFRGDRKALPALALSDGAFLTCASNDFGYENAFARGLEALGRPGDILVIFSTSGSSPNVLNAARAANDLGVAVFGLLGKDGGKVKPLCAYSLVVPGKTSDRIQEIHVKTLHLLVEGIERTLFPENYPSAND